MAPVRECVPNGAHAVLPELPPDAQAVQKAEAGGTSSIAPQVNAFGPLGPPLFTGRASGEEWKIVGMRNKDIAGNGMQHADCPRGGVDANWSASLRCPARHAFASRAMTLERRGTVTARHRRRNPRGDARLEHRIPARPPSSGRAARQPDDRGCDACRTLRSRASANAGASSRRILRGEQAGLLEDWLGGARTVSARGIGGEQREGGTLYVDERKRNPIQGPPPPLPETWAEFPLLSFSSAHSPSTSPMPVTDPLPRPSATTSATRQQKRKASKRGSLPSSSRPAAALPHDAGYYPAALTASNLALADALHARPARPTPATTATEDEAVTSSDIAPAERPRLVIRIPSLAARRALAQPHPAPPPPAPRKRSRSPTQAPDSDEDEFAASFMRKRRVAAALR
ncbi:hypothetical protein AURDEDRAFT_160862 [Auricularia subglabra TFB-10046 SS5]|nr:hypothetical protein AURDEDRAFT_160862 [Auricularia subglabra TFB-10046 SS5]